MLTRLAFSELRMQAIALRRAGKSRREIKELLHIGSNTTLNEALKGEPPPPWTRRPNAKDGLRARARALREEGLDYQAIAADLGVSKSSVSLWVRDLPVPERLSYEERRRRCAEGVARYWETERRLREGAQVAVSAAAAKQIGAICDRELLVGGVIAYWCEGSKNKPYRRANHVTFMNSDPMMIKFYLRFLRAAGVTQDQLAFRLSIHESADVAAAEAFWLGVTQADKSQFRRPNLKRHNPVTIRKNTGDSYHGCLRVQVLRGATLYQQIEGWALALLDAPAAPSTTTSDRTRDLDSA